MVLLRFIEGKWEEIDKKDKQPNDLYLDGGLKKRLDFGRQQIKRNNDVLGIVTGDEGSGKSTLAGNIMRYMTNDKFNPTTQMIGAEDDSSVMNKIEATEDGGAIMFDEGNSYFLSTETMKREQRELHKLFSIFRQKNLFVLIVAPSFFRLNSYFALDRSRFLLQTYIKDGKWGFFNYWGDRRKGRLYRIGKKLHDYGAVNWTIHGRFTKCYSLETEEYKAYKKKTLKDTFEAFRDNKKKVPTPHKIKREVKREFIKNNIELPVKDIARMLRMSERRVYEIRKDIKDAAKDGAE